MTQEFRDLGGRVGQRERERLGRAGLRLRHFLGVVVHQNDAVEPKIKFVGERGQVRAFGLPIDALRREILQRSGISGMRLKRSRDVLFVVLAAEREQHALVPARAHELLQGAARRIEHHALGPILAADAGPQRVVAIERDHLERAAR